MKLQIANWWTDVKMSIAFIANGLYFNGLQTTICAV